MTTPRFSLWLRKIPREMLAPTRAERTALYCSLISSSEGLAGKRRAELLVMALLNPRIFPEVPFQP